MAKSSTHSQIIGIQDLKPGMMVIQVTAQNGPVKVRKSGTVTSFEMVQGLTEMGVLELEIDPSQTLDIESPYQVRKLSQTQQLMQADVIGESVDATLSEQFNRSLFMPSIRDLRSAWYYNAKRYVTGAMVFFVGLALGFGGVKSVDIFSALNAYSIVKDSSNSGAVQEERSDNGERDVFATELADEQAVPSTPKSGALQTSQVVNQEISANQANTENQDLVVKQSEEFTSANNALDGELSDEEIQQRIIRPDTQNEAPVSRDLLAKFNQALADLEEQVPEEENVIEDSAPNIIRIDQLPAWALTSLPKMSFSTHIFASSKQDRWVRVNGVQMREGDWIEGEVQLVEITQHHVILNYQGQSFRMAALTDW